MFNVEYKIYDDAAEIVVVRHEFVEAESINKAIDIVKQNIVKSYTQDEEAEHIIVKADFDCLRFTFENDNNYFVEYYDFVVRGLEG